MLRSVAYSSNVVVDRCYIASHNTDIIVVHHPYNPTLVTPTMQALGLLKLEVLEVADITQVLAEPVRRKPKMDDTMKLLRKTMAPATDRGKLWARREHGAGSVWPMPAHS